MARSVAAPVLQKRPIVCGNVPDSLGPMCACGGVATLTDCGPAHAVVTVCGPDL